MRVLFLAFIAFATMPLAQAGGGPLGIHHHIGFDESGVCKRSSQDLVQYPRLVTIVDGALWEGGETRAGRTFWRSLDSSANRGCALHCGAGNVQAGTTDRGKRSQPVVPAPRRRFARDYRLRSTSSLRQRQKRDPKTHTAPSVSCPSHNFDTPGNGQRAAVPLRRSG